MTSQTETTMPSPFPARWDSTGFCPAGCGSRIRAGDPVTYDADDRLVHAGCVPARDPLEIAPGEIVCGTCWLVKPCRCDD